MGLTYRRAYYKRVKNRRGCYVRYLLCFFFCYVSVYKLPTGKGERACIRRGILRGLYVFRVLGAYIRGSLGPIFRIFRLSVVGKHRYI